LTYKGITAIITENSIEGVGGGKLVMIGDNGYSVSTNGAVAMCISDKRPTFNVACWIGAKLRSK